MAVITGRGTGLSIRRAHLYAGALFLAVLAILAAAHDPPRGAGLTAAQAERAALDSPSVRDALAGGFDRVRTRPLDDESVRVGFFDGPRAVAEAAVASDGEVVALIGHDGLHARVGSDVGQSLPALAGLVLLFLVATLRVPLLRRQNLDAVALAGLAVPIVLLNERYLEWSVLAGAVLLVFLGMRCLGIAARGATVGDWLIDRRATRLLAAGAAAGLVLVSIPGGLASDVGFASLAGATNITDGTLPYGNLPGGELVHGDTYPLLAYLAYVPAALLDPVRDGFAGLEGALWVATGFALLAALALGRAAGSRAALAFLAFPPVMVAASSGSNDTVAAAFVATALGAGAVGSTAALTAAGWVKLGPLALIPLWTARYGPRALTGALAVTAALAIAVLSIGHPGGFADMARAVSFQSERGSFMSVWALLDIPAAQLAFQAGVLTAIVVACLHVRRDRALAGDPRRMAALAAAILIGVQLAANHWSATYLVWVFPLLAVALLAKPVRVPASSPPAAHR